MTLLRKTVVRVAALALGVVIAAAVSELLVRMASIYSAQVRYLATAGLEPALKSYASLEEFLDLHRALLPPHQPYNGYYTNALGFADREFSEEKAPGTLRVMGLGDSFTHGSVSYPQNVLTVAEALLNRDCGRRIEIMNFGISATGLWDYRMVHKLAWARYRPDRVLVHFYMGNDGPDLVFGNTEIPSPSGSSLFRSYAWRYLLNAVNVLRSVDQGPMAEADAAGDPKARGAMRVQGQAEMSDDRAPPKFSEESFRRMAGLEVARTYRGRNLPYGDLWNKTFDALDALRLDVLASTGKPPIVILYPSESQIYTRLRDDSISWIKAEKPAVDPDDFDPDFPGRMVLDYCKRTGTPCYDITPRIQAAAREEVRSLYLPRDTHWNVKGNYVAGTAEADALRNELCGAK